MFELVNAIRENFQRKLKTPLLSMFVGVFFLHNWRLFLYPFFWDEDLSLYTKQAIYDDLFKAARDPYSLLWYLVLSVGAVVVLYTVMTISKAIVLVFENVLLPCLHKHIQGNVVPAETFNNLKTFADDMKKEYDSKKTEFADKIGEAKKLSETLAEMKGRNTLLEQKLNLANDDVEKVSVARDLYRANLLETGLRLALMEVAVKHTMPDIAGTTEKLVQLSKAIWLPKLAVQLKAGTLVGAPTVAIGGEGNILRLVELGIAELSDEKRHTFTLTEYGREVLDAIDERRAEA